MGKISSGLTTKKIKIFSALMISAGLIFVCGFTSIAQSVTQSYGSDEVLQQGTIVGLKKDDLRKVEAINSDSYDRVFGVVIGPSDSSVILTSDAEKTYVAQSGRYNVLVTNQNGDLKTGDYVTLSSISGLGMKASEIDPIVVGKTISSFNSNDSGQVIGNVNVKNATGQEQKLLVGRITIDIAIGKNPNLRTEDNLPDALQRASELIAGKPVNPIKVYMSLVVLFLATAIAGSLIYSGVRGSIIAIGRNPLSRSFIARGLIQVVVIGIIVFLSGIFGVYLLLKL